MTKILVADDSKFMRTVLSSILNKAGYKEIVEAADGIEAVKKFKQEKPDLTLLDIIMEKKGGVDALKDIIAIDQAAKVIIVTAVGQEQMKDEAMKAGAKDYIVKPFDHAQVVRAVEKVLG